MIMAGAVYEVVMHSYVRRNSCNGMDIGVLCYFETDKQQTG